VEESRLQQKLRALREKAALEGIAGKLSGLYTGQGLMPDAVPSWVGETTWGFWDIFVDPLETLPDEAEPQAVDAWIEGVLTRYGITGTVYVASHVRGLPWLKCEVPEQGWVSQVRSALEDPWMFLSETLDVVVAVLEAEYRYELHVGRKPQAESTVTAEEQP
jgi:hypothetical protein